MARSTPAVTHHDTSPVVSFADSGITTLWARTLAFTTMPGFAACLALDNHPGWRIAVAVVTAWLTCALFAAPMMGRATAAHQR